MSKNASLYEVPVPVTRNNSFFLQSQTDPFKLNPFRETSIREER